MTNARGAKPPEDVGTPERGQHGDRIRIEGTGSAHVRVLTQTPLDRYYHEGLITPEQWHAGNRLWRDHYTAGQEPKLVPTLIRVDRQYQGDTTPALVLDAREAKTRAIRALGMLWGVAQWVVIEQGTASRWATHRELCSARNAGATGLAVLRMALDGLIEFYNARDGVNLPPNSKRDRGAGVVLH